MSDHIAALPDAAIAESWRAWCQACSDPAVHRLRLWSVCDQPERPLDDHGLFDRDCPGCGRAWALLRCPRPVPPAGVQRVPVG